MYEVMTAERCQHLRRMKARETIARRTAPDARQHVYRGGYNAITASFTGGIEISKFSGSSFNRSYANKKKLERKAAHEEMEKRKKASGFYDYDNLQLQPPVSDECVRQICNSEPTNKGYTTEALARLAQSFKERKRTRLPYMSQRTKSKVKDKATAFYSVLGEQKTFLTLTFIQDVSEKTAMQIWNKFRTSIANDSVKTLDYLLVKEFQKENNNRIHFHIILSRRLNVKKYNALWVLCQYNSGLRYKHRERGIISEHEINKRYKVSCDKNNEFKCAGSMEEILNPFHIERINSLNGLHHYLVKYITKNDSVGFQHGTWHCSRNVSRLFTRTITSIDNFLEARTEINTRLNKKTGTVHMGRESRGKFHHTIYLQNRAHFQPMLNEMEQINKWIIEGMNIEDIPQETDETIRKFFMNRSVAEVDKTKQIAETFIKQSGLEKERILQTDISFFASKIFTDQQAKRNYYADN